MPTPVSQITPETLRYLLSPSDLIILAILLVNIYIGYRHGVGRALIRIVRSFSAFALATGLARAAAPLMANQVVLPIVGDVFQKQAGSLLQSSVPAIDNGVSLFASLSETLQKLLDVNLLESATQPLQAAAQQTAQRMAESLSYSLLFFIFMFALNALFKILGDVLHLVGKTPPLRALNRLAGGAVGLACGSLLSMLILWALWRFAPAVFSELGPLSPNALNQTLLTKSLLGMIPPGLLGTA